MRKHSMPEMKEGGVNVTPLIDIVMCLIIFFMLVAKIGVTTGSDKNVDVPSIFKNFTGAEIKDMGNTLVLNVVNGPNQSEGPIISALVKNEMVDLKIDKQYGTKMMHPLLDSLTYLREGDPSTGLKPNPDFKVIIRGDKTLSYQFLAPVLIECTKAKVKSFAFALSTVKKPEQDVTAAP